MNYSPELQSALAELTRSMPTETPEQRTDKRHAEQAFALGWLHNENQYLRDQIAQLEKESAPC
jgi:hypothetical protein